MTKTLYKRNKTGSIQVWTIEVEGNQHRTIIGKKDGKMIVGEWTTEKGKNIGKSNETTPHQQALLVAERKIKKQLENHYVENIKDVDKNRGFQPMLAAGLKIDELKYPVLTQPKLDGLRCIVTVDGMFSRNGKPIISAPHIYEQLAPLFDSDPTLIFDGELYNHELKDDFNTIISLARKTKPKSEDLEQSAKMIEYWIYDLPRCQKNDDSTVFSTRMLMLHDLIEPLNAKNIKLTPTNNIFEEKDVMSYFQDYLAAGYEGQMIRLDEPYEQRRSKSLLKHKEFQDTEYVIIDIGEGRGKRKGTAGFLVHENEEGRQFHSNLKFTYDEAKEIWENRDSYIGKTATVKFFNKTPDNIPRFPYAVKIAREDYE